MAPETMRALTVQNRTTVGKFFYALSKKPFSSSAHVSTIDVPGFAPTDILIRIHAAALNPTDWKHIAFISQPGVIMGCDFAGTVESVGSLANETFSPGDRVGGTCHGGQYTDEGAFAEYLKMPASMVWKVPESMSFKDAATFGVASATGMLALYHTLGLPWPDDESAAKRSAATQPHILIYGGATSTGMMALQMAKHAGYAPVTTCSPRNFDLCKSLGAVECFDYNDGNDVPDKIRAQYPKIRDALDCISEGGTPAFCARVMQGNEGARCVLLLPKMGSKQSGTVEFKPIMAYTCTGRAFQMPIFGPLGGPKYDVVPEDHEALKRWYKLLPGLVESGVLKPLPTEEVPGGLDGVIDGLEKMRSGGVSGKKLVAEFDTRN